MLFRKCSGICEKYQTTRRYDNGKKCVYCNMFLKIEESNCPCCGKFLRTTPKWEHPKLRIAD